MVVRIFFLAFLTLSAPLLCAVDLPVVVDQSHSQVRLEMKTDFSGFNGELSDYHIDVLADSETGKITSAQLNFLFSGIKTGDLRRDRDMLAWENSDQFPEVVCTLTHLDPNGGSKFTAHGQVLFHGVQKDISFPVNVSVSANQSYIVDGEAYIDTRDYGLPKVRKYWIITLNPIVHVFFHLQAELIKKG